MRALALAVVVFSFCVVATQARTCFTSISTLQGTDVDPCPGGTCAADWQIGVDPVTHQVDLFWVVIGPHRRPLTQLYTSEPVVSAVCDDQGATVSLAISARYTDGASTFTWTYAGAGVGCADLYDGSAPDTSLLTSSLQVSIVGTGSWSTGELVGAGYALGSLSVNCADLPVQQLDNDGSSSSSGYVDQQSTLSTSSVATTAFGGSSYSSATTGSGYSSSASSSGTLSSSTGYPLPETISTTTSGASTTGTGSSYTGGVYTSSGGMFSSSTSSGGDNTTDFCIFSCQQQNEWRDIEGSIWDDVSDELALCGVTYREVAVRGHHATKHLEAVFAHAVQDYVEIEMILRSGADCDSTDLPWLLQTVYEKLSSEFVNASACTGDAAETLELDAWNQAADDWIEEQMCATEEGQSTSVVSMYRRTLDPYVDCQLRFKGNDTNRCLKFFSEGFCLYLFNASKDGWCATRFGIDNRNNVSIDLAAEDARIVSDKDDNSPVIVLYAEDMFPPGKTVPALTVVWHCQRREVRQLLWCVKTNTRKSGKVERCARAEFRVDNCKMSDFASANLDNSTAIGQNSTTVDQTPNSTHVDQEAFNNTVGVNQTNVNVPTAPANTTEET